MLVERSEEVYHSNKLGSNYENADDFANGLSRNEREESIDSEMEYYMKVYLRNLDHLSTRDAITTIVYSMINSCLIALPFAASQSGIIIFILTSAVIALCSSFTSIIVINMAKDQRVKTLEDLAEKAFPKTGFYAVCAFQLMFSLTLMCITLSVWADITSDVFHSRACSNTIFYTKLLASRHGEVVMGSLIIFPVCIFKKSMSSLRWTSDVTVFAIAAALLSVFANYITDSTENEERYSSHDINRVMLPRSQWFIVIYVVTFCYTYNQKVFNVYNRLADKNYHNWKFVVRVATLVILFVLLLFGIFGFLSANRMDGPMKNMNFFVQNEIEDSVLFDTSRLIVAVCLLFTIPVDSLTASTSWKRIFARISKADSSGKVGTSISVQNQHYLMNGASGISGIGSAYTTDYSLSRHGQQDLSGRGSGLMVIPIHDGNPNEKGTPRHDSVGYSQLGDNNQQHPVVGSNALHPFRFNVVEAIQSRLWAWIQPKETGRGATARYFPFLNSNANRLSERGSTYSSSNRQGRMVSQDSSLEELLLQREIEKEWDLTYSHSQKSNSNTRKVVRILTEQDHSFEKDSSDAALGEIENGLGSGSFEDSSGLTEGDEGEEERSCDHTGPVTSDANALEETKGEGVVGHGDDQTRSVSMRNRSVGSHISHDSNRLSGWDFNPEEINASNTSTGSPENDEMRKALAELSAINNPQYPKMSFASFTKIPTPKKTKKLRSSETMVDGSGLSLPSSNAVDHPHNEDNLSLSPPSDPASTPLFTIQEETSTPCSVSPGSDGIIPVDSHTDNPINHHNVSGQSPSYIASFSKSVGKDDKNTSFDGYVASRGSSRSSSSGTMSRMTDTTANESVSPDRAVIEEIDNNHVVEAECDREGGPIQNRTGFDRLFRFLSEVYPVILFWMLNVIVNQLISHWVYIAVTVGTLSTAMLVFIFPSLLYWKLGLKDNFEEIPMLPGCLLPNTFYMICAMTIGTLFIVGNIVLAIHLLVTRESVVGVPTS